MEEKPEDEEKTRDKGIVTFIRSTPRKSQNRIWKQGLDHLCPIPEEEAAEILAWGPEDLFVMIAKLSEVRGRTLTVRVETTETVVERT